MKISPRAMKRVRFFLRPWVRSLKVGDRVCKPYSSRYSPRSEYQAIIQEVGENDLRVLVFGFNNPRTLWQYHELRPWWASLVQPLLLALSSVIFTIYCIVQAFR
jgi:hypothetical protein